ncbi:MAG: DUF4097 family beta strand repeat-containing protein [Myxococcota bacterium]|nr:DUF4097 family beta strand repeat-containing protein [Myxococcota bacterium]
MRPRDGRNGSGREGGFGSFVRSLLAGVPWSEHAERDDLLRLPRPASGVIRIHNANGKTRLVGEERSDVELLAHKNARAESSEAAQALLDSIRVIHESAGDVLEIEVDVPRKWNRRGCAHLELRVPRGLSAQIVAANGRVGIEHLRGSVRARSSNGSVDITDVVGDIEVATSNAKVCCSCTVGRLVARSSNGKIELEDHCGSVDASTSNGLIRASLESLGRDGVHLATSNGRIVLDLPEKVDAEVDIRVDNGVIRNDRELCKAARERSGQLRGRLGNGGALIKLRTSNGSVSLS